MEESPGLLIGRVYKEAEEGQWMRFGIPLPKGYARNTESMGLADHTTVPLSCAFKPLTHWVDGSIKWLLCDSLIYHRGPIFLTEDQPKINTQDVHGIAHPTKHASEGIQLPDGTVISIKATKSTGGALTFESHIDLLDENNLVNRTRAVFKTTQAPLTVQLLLESCPISKEWRVQPTIHNTAAASHPGGCWDLGDANSVHLQEFRIEVLFGDHRSVMLELTDTDTDTDTGTGTGTDTESGSLVIDLTTEEVTSLQQHASGGEHWQSPNHINGHGEITLKQRGYSLTQKDSLTLGLRATPCIVLKGSGNPQYLVPEFFWQNSPARLDATHSHCEWWLFSEKTELQPGEAKTWVLRLGPSRQNAQFELNPELLADSQSWPGFSLPEESVLTRITEQGLTGEHCFQAKRETIDEFGWRNFGELYADHEALNQTPDQGLFVSHYNNQYDPIHGLTQRWLATGNTEWQSLSRDLLWHVIDIDVYKTDEDKAEYNHGLFWHTDHYLRAETATHRTYSRHHKAAYDGHQGGGGPGGQHCYTSGLALNYLLSGDERIKEVVENMTNWVRCFYNGAPSLLARCFRFITIDRKAGQLTNIGWVAPGYKYPLDRGTANYLNALIDHFLIGGSSELLLEMDEVIRETLSPTDDLVARQLSDVENQWFYVVFLQALARFMVLKEQLEQIDPAYSYARHAFMHYAHWLKDNDPPYLDHPEKLEFPTDTWAAQDLRKANVLYYASYFALTGADTYRVRADFFYQYCCNHLSQSPEAHTTRIQALILQNLGGREWVQKHRVSAFTPQPVESLIIQRRTTTGRLLRDCMIILKRFSLRTEIHWLKVRVRDL